MNPNFPNISQEDFEHLERYLNGSMSENEATEFEERIKRDSSLDQYLKEQRILLQAVEEQSLLHKLDDFHSEVTSKVITLDSNKSKEKSSFYSKLAIAASLAVIIGLGGFWLFNQSNTPQKVFAVHFKPDPGLATTMGDTSQFEFYDAMVDYKYGDYTKALKKWESLLIKKPKNDTLNYFVGVAHLANEDENSAIEHLIPVSQNKASFFYKDAQLYVGLAYLKAGNVALAKKHLTVSDTEISKQIIAELEN